MQFLALSVSLSHYKFVLYGTSVLLRRQTNRDVVQFIPHRRSSRRTRLTGLGLAAAQRDPRAGP
jgi:hypothetical protein